MDNKLDDVLAKLDAGLPDALQRLCAFLRIPSISTDRANDGDVATAAKWLADELGSLGFDAQIHDTLGHPMIVATTPQGPDRTLLFYGHYDVQPVDPLDLWDRDPFDPVIEDTASGQVIRARGASDDKGQLMTFVEACRAWKTVHGTLPSGLTLLFEGEEESGSPSLIPFLEAHRDILSQSLALICDTGMSADGRPAISTQLRGMVGEEVVVRGADRDLHSGSYGGLAANPILILCNALSGLKDDNGRITLEKFYDGVAELTQTQQRDWDALDFDAEAYLSGVGLQHPIGEKGRHPLEMMWNQPTAEINGITGGYTGNGFKTVLPAEARAKVSFRLTGTQDPQRMRAAFRSHIKEYIPADCTVEFYEHGGSPASVMDVSDPAFKLAKEALGEEWQREAVFIGMGGSIPVAGDFKRILDMDSMLIGFARDDDRIHSPNEKYNVESFAKGARSWARILTALRPGATG